MEEPLTHNSTVLKHSLAIHIYSTAGNQQLEHRHPARFRPSPLLSQPDMRRQAEINRFAIFLFCSLVPLGSLAPTAISEESKTTTGHREKHFTTRIKPLASIIEMKATNLFKNYNACISVTPQTVTWLMANSQAKEMVKKIPKCPAFEADCCVFHIFYNILQNVRSNIEFICGKNLTLSVDANTSQLNAMVSGGATRYSCQNKKVDHSEVQSMDMAGKQAYIWQVLQKYEQVMQKTRKIYSSAEM